MATPFAEIYNRAIFKFADYNFLPRLIGQREEVLEKYLVSAKTDFRKICRIDLDDCDMVTKQFNQDLGDEEQEILALGVAYYWLSFMTLNSKLLKNVLNSKDYSYFSPGNLLHQIRGLRKDVYSEWNVKMNAYSFDNSRLSTLRN